MDPAERTAQQNQQALTAAILALTQYLQAQPAPPAAVAIPAHVPLLDPFASPNAFDLSSRAGSSAFHTASAPLSNTWDGDVDSFPPFVIALKLRAREMHWTAAPPTGVSTITDAAGTNHNLFDEYFSITTAEAETARVARTNDRATQNSRAMYKCLQRSITGDLFTIIFEQAANIPHEDGPTLFLVLTSYTVSSSVQLSMNAIQRLMAFDPAQFKYEIPRINTTLLHLFVMASSPGRPLAEPERIQYILTTYIKIRQPESWASWVRTQTERVEDGTSLITSQTLLNKAVLKYNKIKSTESNFNGSTSSIQEDIVAMFAKKASPKASKAPNKDTDSKSTDDSKKPNNNADKPDHPQPPFVKHYKSSPEPDAPKFKLGDKKEWKGSTYHFCDCPNHRARIKWHTHKPDDCNTRIRWLAEKSGTTPSPPTANVADTTGEEGATPPPADDATALLASVMNTLTGNADAQASIADAIHALSTE